MLPIVVYGSLQQFSSSASVLCLVVSTVDRVADIIQPFLLGLPIPPTYLLALPSINPNTVCFAQLEFFMREISLNRPTSLLPITRWMTMSWHPTLLCTFSLTTATKISCDVSRQISVVKAGFSTVCSREPDRVSP